MNRDELRKRAAELNIAGRSKMTKDQLEVAVREATPKDGLSTPAQTPESADTPAAKPAGKQQTDDTVAIDSLSDTQRDLIEQANWDRHVANTLPVDSPERDTHCSAMAVDFGKPMGLHYRGRAMGAKHYNMMIQALSPQNYQADWPGINIPRSHTPNSERVQKYARQQRSKMIGHFYPKLTHRQMRRVRKNDRKHNGGFGLLYTRNRERMLSESYSLLARTPEGMGIYYKFMTP